MPSLGSELKHPRIATVRWHGFQASYRRKDRTHLKRQTNHSDTVPAKPQVDLSAPGQTTASPDYDMSRQWQAALHRPLLQFFSATID